VKTPFWSAAAVNGLLLAILASLALIPVPPYSRLDRSPLNRILRTLHRDELNREARERQTAGYYEGLLNEGSRVAGMNALITGNNRFAAEYWMRPGRRHRGDYLYWDMPPNLNARDPDNPRFDLATNSHGMADREYALHKPERTWRIALLGDSITRGQGAPFGRNFEFLLEERLNADHFEPTGHRLEILNFAVGGYRTSQLADVALERVPPFAPDLYVVPLSELSVFRRWGDHIATLVQNDIDPKYDFIRNMVREAGVRPSDPSGTIAAKLARFRLPTLQWMLEQVKIAAARQNARVLVILLANGTEPEMLEDEFAGVRELVADLNIPSLDLLDAFADVDNPLAYRVSDENNHPNELGHRRLYELLHQRITSDATLFRIFCGPDVPLPPTAVTAAQ
jgi:lysophospholipase L1-like esterase